MEHRIRFNLNANTNSEAIEYLNSRAKQLLRHNFKLVDISEFTHGVTALFERDGTTFQSTYILEQYRNKGLYRNTINHTILTTPDCGIEAYLIKHNIDYVCVENSPFIEYDLISEFYQGDRASRSGVEFMNHIDEGLYILNRIGASETAKKAYCLHPMLQSDIDLVNNIGNFQGIDPAVLITTVEYRSVANAYLSTRDIEHLSDIKISPLDDVNDMLIADKIQNKKDFMLHHKGTHPKSSRLERYFNNWLEVFGMEYEYEFCAEVITTPTFKNTQNV
jgi:hypothetical protein